MFSITPVTEGHQQILCYTQQLSADTPTHLGQRLHPPLPQQSPPPHLLCPPGHQSQRRPRHPQRLLQRHHQTQDPERVQGADTDGGG
jgi:hypothetical protein